MPPIRRGLGVEVRGVLSAVSTWSDVVPTWGVARAVASPSRAIRATSGSEYRGTGERGANVTREPARGRDVPREGRAPQERAKRATRSAVGWGGVWPSAVRFECGSCELAHSTEWNRFACPSERRAVAVRYLWLVRARRFIGPRGVTGRARPHLVRSPRGSCEEDDPFDKEAFRLANRPSFCQKERFFDKEPPRFTAEKSSRHSGLVSCSCGAVRSEQG
jgi:hypothetical protein